MQYLEALVRATRRTCIAARESGVHAHHREVFGALRDAAANRVVVHVTTNIDGIATTVAVKVFGAVWRPVERYGEEIPIADIRRDVLEVFAAGSGQLHLPVHGEAGLAAVKGLPEWEGAQRLVQTGLQHDTAYSTLAQGIGQTVREIETLMAVSGLGYGLLASLLVGTVADVDRMIGPYPPADLVTIGYGAGATDGRLAYPFERRVREARQRGFSPQGSRWLALVYRGDSEDADSRPSSARRGGTTKPGSRSGGTGRTSWVPLHARRSRQCRKPTPTFRRWTRRLRRSLHDRAGAALRTRLAQHSRGILPEFVVRDARLDDVLVDPPIGGPPADAFARQFFSANVDPSERYVGILAGTTKFWLRTDESGLRNLTLTGGRNLRQPSAQSSRDPGSSREDREAASPGARSTIHTAISAP